MLDVGKQVLALEIMWERLLESANAVPREDSTGLFSRYIDAAKQCARRIEDLKGIRS